MSISTNGGGVCDVVRIQIIWRLKMDILERLKQIDEDTGNTYWNAVNVLSTLKDSVDEIEKLRQQCPHTQLDEVFAELDELSFTICGYYPLVNLENAKRILRKYFV